MSVHSTHFTIGGVLLTLGASCAAAEFLGYWLHRLLHSDKFPALSQGHLIHHFLIYGPDQAMRYDKYQDATHGRFSVGNVGLEWLAPCALIFFSIWGILYALRIPPVYVAISLLALVGWPVLMFSYLHDRMHLKDFWMARTPILKIWFCRARRLHEIHHRALNDHGRMHANFGIGFFWFDRLFRTIGRHHLPLNQAGLGVAIQRYGLLERNGRLESSTEAQIHAAVGKHA
ncbi:MAG: sterol desaturase family protein [Acidobacteria bacterium]|nr:sterol desaturase family protein [Acidobacteriota bacterium]MBS1864873.1 sterol desaturase family protein [Acidobacteriota bacterium]